MRGNITQKGTQILMVFLAFRGPVPSVAKGGVRAETLGRVELTSVQEAH